MSTLFYNACLVTPEDLGKPLSGAEQGRVRTISGGALLVRNGLIAAVGEEAEVRRLAAAELAACGVDKEVDLGGACVIPGFVDPHTHMCFARLREEEFSMRLQGKTYLEILEQGGGILSSVDAVRNASDDDLFAMTRRNALNALAQGTTTVEIKSGYGLDVLTELRMLRVIDRVRRETPLDVVATFMGAHAVPREYKANPDAFADEIINTMLPAVAAADLARFCDVFCETGVFSVDQSRRMLSAARELGFDLKIHADEVNNLGGASLAAAMGAVSAEHLLAADDTGLAAMGKAGTIAVLLPATAYSLHKPYARGLDMIALCTPVALSTDCNPGSSFCDSMPFVMGLAILQMGLSPEQALVASTLNAAYALGRAYTVGSLDVGKQADFLVLEGATPACIAYHAGANPVVHVYKKGVLVAEKGRILA